jgi:hypothetical protein
LKDIGATAEEAKADVMGVCNVEFMMQKGELPSADRSRLLATYFVSLLRAVRFGDQEAHGHGAALQYGYLESRGAFAWDAGQRRFRIDDARMSIAVRDLVGELVRLQGDGDYAGMVAFFDRYAHLDDRAREVIRAELARRRFASDLSELPILSAAADLVRMPRRAPKLGGSTARPATERAVE